MNRLCLFIYFWSIPVLMEDKELQYTHTQKMNLQATSQQLLKPSQCVLLEAL